MGIDNLADPRAEAKAARRNTRALATSSPAGNTSVSEGAFEIRSLEGLIVSGSARVGGTLRVSGTQNVDGALNVSGTETVSGTLVVTGTERVDGTLRIAGHFIVDGDTNVTGPMHVTGVWTMDGNGTINGDTGLYGNLVVQGGGRITVAGGVQMKIGQLGSGIGGITWGTAFPSVYSDGAQVGMGTAPSSYLAASSSGPGMLRGTRAFSIDDSSHFMSNPAATGLSANVAVDVSTGRLYRSSSALRYKHNIRTVDHDPRLLRKVRVVLFDDIQTGTKDIAGVIGEVVAKNGGEAFVRRGADNRVETVDYDRLALARTEILAKESDELREENGRLRDDVEELKRQVAALVATGSPSASEASAPSAG